MPIGYRDKDSALPELPCSQVTLVCIRLTETGHHSSPHLALAFYLAPYGFWDEYHHLCRVLQLNPLYE